ncbi:MAG TPA: serine hydrolase domain-containing protein [Acidimicrobiales bacterium]|nr:serine hydrolase domain-containing protein [Acidimicrobiales bacterium]
MTVDEQAIGGFVAPGLEAVREEFERNFAERGEVGAAFAATRHGELVVDLWGGLADSDAGRPWTADTAQVVFSGTKGLVALCLLMLVDRGALDVEDPVARYWPEFAEHAKDSLTVAELASHRARLPAVEGLETPEDFLDPLRLAQLLASQRQSDDPRAGFVYHALTYGWLCGELVRRVDGRSVGAFFAEEVAGPLGLQIWIGTPPEVEARIATLEYAPGWNSLSIKAGLPDDPLWAAIWTRPWVFPADDLYWNRRPFHEAEIPGAGGVGEARSMARLYGCLALGGELDGVRLLSEETLALGRRLRASGPDPFSGLSQAFGVGFAVQTERKTMGAPEDAFGHGGAGGSMHAAWPSQRVGVSYAMNQMRDADPVDARRAALLDRLYEALDADA